MLILVSKFGHCLNDLLYRNSIGHLPMELVAVVSNHEDMRRRVEAEGTALHPSAGRGRRTRGAQEAALAALVADERIDLVVLARYMQILSHGLCTHARRARHQHPPLVPAELRRCAALSARRMSAASN